MDPSKSPNAPGWTSDEKTTMGQTPPPPYQDHPQYPNPGYPPANLQGYGSPQYGGPAYGQQPYPTGAGQQYPGYPGVATVTVQPTVYVTRPPLEHPVNDYLCYSVFTLLCCCLPLGIAALIYSISAREANHAGDQLAAERSSRMARILNHVSLGIGLTLVILSIIYVVVVSSSLH
ncbi:proline-rich transmembrane protein 1 [Centroberyx affinis]|uniref:proline-rich transmembrane protein 1 n=1 Tax=Centroberyx affinis TaxID=166261 RepID=UPI003A5C1E8D